MQRQEVVVVGGCGGVTHELAAIAAAFCCTSRFYDSMRVRRNSCLYWFTIHPPQLSSRVRV